MKLAELTERIATAGPGAEVSFDVDGRMVNLVEVRVALVGEPAEGFVTVVLTERKADGEADSGQTA